MRVTFNQVAASRIPNVLGLCNSVSTRLAAYVNDAQQRLLQRPEKFWGTYARYRVCTPSRCLTWPRQFAAIELASVCNSPIAVRSLWFEFLESGWGLRDANSCDLQLFDRGQAPAFEDICGSGKKIKVYCDAAETSGAYILLQGYDENNNWVRTEYSGTWVDGERVLLNDTTPQTTVNYFSAFTGAIKPQTNGVVRLYELNVALATQRPIAYYEWDEETPLYRRSFIPGISESTCDDDGDADDCCDVPAVEVIAKLDHIPVRNGDDYLIIGNIPALKEMCQALKHYEDNAVKLGQLAEARAVQLMKNEARHYEGAGTQNVMNFQGEGWGAGNLPMVY